jgi:PAS domain S-box-containing protein
MRLLPPTPPAVGTSPAEAAIGPRRYVVLPLVVRRAHVFGVLQVESASAISEADVLFLDSVTNQVAVAIDRQMSIDAAEVLLHAQLDFTRAITGSLGEGVIATDADGSISFMNPAAEEILGWSERAVVGQPVDEVLRVRGGEGGDRETVWCPLRQALATGERVVSDDHAFVAADGRAILVSYIAAPICGAHGTSGAVLAFREVLEVKRAERAQRLLAECSAALGESLDPAAMLAALVERVVPWFADALYLDVTDAHGSPSRFELSSTEAAETKAKVPLAQLVVSLRARGRSFGTLTFVLTRSEYAYSPVDVAVAQEIGRRTAIALENARLHAQTEKAVRDRQEILAVVSHDLRSPLNTIAMAADSIQERARSAQRQDEDTRTVAMIARAAARMLRMTQDLLDVSSIEANQLAIDPKPTRVTAIVHELLEALDGTARERSLELTATQTDPTLVVYCDRDRILQVLTNLVGNALKFTGPGGRIDVAIEPNGDQVRFIVCDTGSGISPELVPHVFDRYRQAAETASQGRGLGLFITKGIVEAHGGVIRVDSEPGLGTAFEFSLPRLAPSSVDETTATEEPAPAALNMDTASSSRRRPLASAERTPSAAASPRASAPPLVRRAAAT